MTETTTDSTWRDVFQRPVETHGHIVEGIPGAGLFKRRGSDDSDPGSETDATSGS